MLHPPSLGTPFEGRGVHGAGTTRIPLNDPGVFAILRPMMNTETVKSISGLLLDLVYPRACQHCGAPADGMRFFCWECLSDFHYVQSPFCSLCGDPVPGHIDHEYLCVYCSRKTPHFDGARSAVRYEGAVGLAIRAVKYHWAVWLTPDMVGLLEACLLTHYALLPFDGICYVPLHSVKRRERGFNQAELLAGLVARKKRLRLYRGVLRKTRDTMSQTHLTAAQRASNVAGVFEVARPDRVKGRRLLLIDDVMTTGATVNECARVLKQAGAESVHVLTVARG